MKKLMFVAAAALCGAVIADEAITSANIVGYAQTTSEESADQYAVCPIVGGQFFNVNGATTFSLADLKVPGTCTWETEEEEGWWEADCMVPGNECIRVFRTDYLAESAVYTYISEGFIKMNLFNDVPEPDLTDYKWAIGWWVNGDIDYEGEIQNGTGTHTSEYKLDDAAVTFKNGTAFIGQFNNTHAINIQTSGEVACKTFGYASAETVCPIIGNQLPVDIDLSDIAVPGTCTWETEGEEGWWEADCMVPGNEYVRIFRTDYPAESAAYTYISEGFIKMNLFNADPDPDLTNYAWAIGWWVNGDIDYEGEIQNGTSTHTSEYKVTTPVPVKAGCGFIGQLNDTHSLQFNFPSAIDVPSKQ